MALFLECFLLVFISFHNVKYVLYCINVCCTICNSSNSDSLISFSLWDTKQVHLRLQGKLFCAPPTMKHNVTVNVHNVMENKPTADVKMHLIIRTNMLIVFITELKLSLIMLYNN